MARELFGDDRHVADHFLGRAGDFPLHLGRELGEAAIDLRSKSSTTSGRRRFHHTLAVLTFLPFFNTRGSGRWG